MYEKPYRDLATDRSRIEAYEARMRAIPGCRFYTGIVGADGLDGIGSESVGAHRNRLRLGSRISFHSPYDEYLDRAVGWLKL